MYKYSDYTRIFKRIMKENTRLLFSAIRCLRKKRPLASHAVDLESPPLPPNVNVELPSGDLSACEINARFRSRGPCALGQH